MKIIAVIFAKTNAPKSYNSQVAHRTKSGYQISLIIEQKKPLFREKLQLIAGKKFLRTVEIIR